MGLFKYIFIFCLLSQSPHLSQMLFNHSLLLQRVFDTAVVRMLSRV